MTSPTGAAIRDILHVLERRFPAIPVLIHPVPVQGAQAAAEIIAAIVRGIAGSAGSIASAIGSAISSAGGGIVGDIKSLIPHFAAGGIVNTPTLAVIGEAGPEAVVPLSGLSTAQPGALPTGAGGTTTAGPVFNTTIYGSEQTPADITQQMYLALRPLLTNA